MVTFKELPLPLEVASATLPTTKGWLLWKPSSSVELVAYNTFSPNTSVTKLSSLSTFLLVSLRADIDLYLPWIYSPFRLSLCNLSLKATMRSEGKIDELTRMLNRAPLKPEIWFDLVIDIFYHSQSASCQICSDCRFSSSLKPQVSVSSSSFQLLRDQNAPTTHEESDWDEIQFCNKTLRRRTLAWRLWLRTRCSRDRLKWT